MTRAPVFYYDGGKDAEGYFVVVDATTGKPIPGWYTGTPENLGHGPFNTKQEAEEAANPAQML